MMINRVCIFLCCVCVLGGCGINDEPMPQIVSGSSYAPRVIPPRIIAPKQNVRGSYSNISRSWFPPSQLEKGWRAVIVHHSATDFGNAAIFDKWHRERNHWEGVGYDFVIGNGTDSDDGEVEVTFRWRKQIPGAHCRAEPNNWANEDGIGICLVGNFDKTAPSSRQIQSLLKLIHFLQKRYGIPNNRIYGHQDTPGARVTDCPGRNLSISRLRSMLN
ncbi:MAG: N-acetylmuramoyl-L-alanine amidase [Planctomycetes bacterium]|nr:N-acetylmuramoyl-L-alanine amidase [Planctomycetota bacterium]MBL7145121.1 N-acetylmuramoyl-L-alanine amidase [Phycisphaerae bacterium]